MVAARSPADCFDTAIEAVRIALRHMTPVILLTDGYIANASELWPIPEMDSYSQIKTEKPTAETQQAVFDRNPETLARLWAAPGDPRFIYRVGGIEKDAQTGNISYDAANHQAMTDIRADKVASVANFIADQEIDQGVRGGVAVVAWGSTYGTLSRAVKECIDEGLQVAHIHIRHINPLPSNLAALLAEFDQVLVPELNTGQLATLLRDKLNIPLKQFNKVTGQPLHVSEVKAAIQELAPQRIQQVGG